LSGMQGGVPLGVGDCLVCRVECHSVWVIVWYAGWNEKKMAWVCLVRWDGNAERVKNEFQEVTGT